MFKEILRLWSFVPAFTAAVWHSGFIGGMYGWDLGRKVFVLHFTAVIQERNSNNYSL